LERQLKKLAEDGTIIRRWRAATQIQELLFRASFLFEGKRPEWFIRECKQHGISPTIEKGDSAHEHFKRNGRLYIY
jgi:hypothetical protein